MAYELKPGQMSGAPAWINSERYDIDAKMDAALGADPKPGEMLPYVENLMENRFGLKFHKETKEMPVYALVVAKGGVKMRESKPEEQGPRIRMGRGQLTCTKVDMNLFARELLRAVGRPVLNQTELTASYNFELVFTPEGPAGGGPGGLGVDGPAPGPGPGTAPGGDGPTVFTSVQEQLDLKLNSNKAPVQMFSIDKMRSRKRTNNLA